MKSSQDPVLSADLKLSDTLDLAAAPSLAVSLLALRGRDVMVDASDVRHLGAPCAQVLVSAITTWRVESRSITFRDPTFAFSDGGRLLGLSHFLNSEC